jgi:hypothetical protein
MRQLAGGIIVVALLACGCSADPPALSFIAVTFNTGTNPGQPHDDPPDDGYSSADADISDMWYGDGMAWLPAIDAARRLFAEVSPDLVGFQEIFHTGDCPNIPPEYHDRFACSGWSPGDPTVAQMALGGDYQVACHLDKPDKCLAVHRRFGSFRACDADLCLDGLAGAEVPDCGSGSRIGRGVVDLVAGGALTVVNIHGSSGFTAEDQRCRVAQFDQVFVDLGDGAPAASGAVNVIVGDLNTDPGRLAGGEDSATRFAAFVGDGQRFHFVTDVGEDATPTYAGAFNIDHVVSDAYQGSCWAAGISEGHPAVIEAIYFDHVPIVCTLAGPLPTATRAGRSTSSPSR